MSPVQTIREYSFLSNPRTPSAVVASTGHATIRSGGSRGEEIARLKRDYRQYKVLNLTNVDAVDATKEVLTTAQALAFRHKFGHVSGSWCCAPTADAKRGMPQNAFFSLMGGGDFWRFG